MRQILSSLMIAMLLLGIVSCASRDSAVTPVTPTIMSESDTVRDISYLPSVYCGEATVVPLIAGQSTTIGEVIVANDDQFLYVEYVTQAPWVLVETHIAVSDSLEGIPQTKTGNPKVGQFAYNIDSEIGLVWSRGTLLYVAADAEVWKLDENGQVVQEETAWGEGISFPGNNWAMYFNHTVQSNPENGELIWAKRAGGTSFDEGYGITTLSDNSTVVTGGFYGPATFGPGEPNQTVLTSAGYSNNVFIARYNPDGTLAWAKGAEGTPSSNRNYCYGITTLSDDSTVVTGWFYESVTFGPGEPNQTILSCTGGGLWDCDIFIARYNPDGTLAWVKRAGGTSYDEGNGITTLSDNSIVVTGQFYASATFGSGEPNQTILTLTSHSDIFVARYNPNGTLVWAKQAGGTYGNGAAWGRGITTLSDNSTVVTGEFNGPARFGTGEPNQTVLTSVGGNDIFIARYNPDGTLAWAKRAGGVSSGGDGCCSITTLSDNSTVVTGFFEGPATFGSGEPNQTVLASAGWQDIFVAHYNPDGTLAWAKRAGGDYTRDCGNGITALSDDSVVVTGIFNVSATFGPGEPNQTVLSCIGDSVWDCDIFIARYNPDGTLAWAKRAGAYENDSGMGITTLSDDSAVATGYYNGSATYGYATFGPGEPNQTVLTSAGHGDIFIARFVE